MAAPNPPNGKAPLPRNKLVVSLTGDDGLLLNEKLALEAQLAQVKEVRVSLACVLRVLSLCCQPRALSCDWKKGWPSTAVEDA
jgi:hypothetical protein